LQNTKRLVVAALFGAIIALTKLFLPFPLDKMFIVVEAVLLGISALLIKRVGATYVGFVVGLLTAFMRPALGLFSFSFALLYGVLIDFFIFALRVRSNDKVSTIRMVTALTISSGIIGFAGYYVTVVILELIQMDIIFAVPIIVMGSISGAIAGYAAAYLWNKHLKNFF
jgi:hypothetical protein